MSKGLPPSEQLLAFITVVELEGFTAAATRLNLTQSAVSHQVKKLERRLGLRLISRESKALMLTDAGASLYASIAEPLTDLLNAFDDYPAQSSGARLRIQVEARFASAWLSPRLPAFLRRFPDLQLEQMRSSNAFFGDRFEIAIKWGSGVWPKCNAEALMAVDYTPVCSPLLLKSVRPLKVAQDLRRCTLLHDRRYGDWQRWFALAGMDARHARKGHLADDTDIVIEMARSGQGVALANPQLLEREIDAGALILPFPQIRMAVEERYYIVTKKKACLSEYAQVFVSWLKQQVSDDPHPIITSQESRSRR